MVGQEGTLFLIVGSGLGKWLEVGEIYWTGEFGADDELRQKGSLLFLIPSKPTVKRRKVLKNL